MHEVSKQLYDGVVRTPKQRVEEACAWIAHDYPHKWLRLVNLCEREAANPECKLISRDYLYSMALRQGLTISECEEFRMDHNLWSILSRYLLMFRPNLASVIHPRYMPETVDSVDLEAMWKECVRPQTFFLADSWREAELAVRRVA